MHEDALLCESRMGRLYEYICDLSDEDLKFTNRHGETLLHYAALGDNAKAAAFIIKTGIDVNQKTKHGRLAIHLAAANVQPEVIQVLCQAGADIDMEDPDTGISAHQLLIRFVVTRPFYVDAEKAKLCFDFCTRENGFL